MSFDLYLQVFQHGKPAGVSQESIRAAFGNFVVEVDDDYWQIQFSDDVSCDIFLQPLPENADLIHTLSIHRPCNDIRLWQAIFLLLEHPGTVFYFPSCRAPIARDAHASGSMPEEMRNSLGEPVTISSALEIFESVESI